MTKPIIIGNYCWICNSTTITGGAVIPDKTIVASNSLVNKNFSSLPPASIIGGIPAKHIKTGFRRLDALKHQRLVSKYFRDHNEENLYNFTTEDDDIFCKAEN